MENKNNNQRVKRGLLCRQHKHVVEVLDRVVFKWDWTLHEETMKYQPSNYPFVF